MKLDNSSGEAGQIDGDIGDTASTVVQSTDTGDNSRPVLWSIFAIIGMLGIWLVITFGRKRNKDI